MSNSTSDPREKAAARAAYKMPAASVGACLWRPSPTDEFAIPALITQVGNRSVMLTVFAVDNRGGLPKDGVRHISDPELSDNPDRSSGCWDYTPDQIALHAFMQLVNDQLGASEKLAIEIGQLKTLIGA